jgi:deoxyhypusine synthase
MKNGPVSKFIEKHFQHFNAATVIDAAKAYEELLSRDGKMMITLAGAMSTAELGKSLAEMIRQDKVHIICCTGANLEEDLYNLVAHSYYKRVPNYRDLSPEEEKDLLDQKFNRVTDTCIPEEEAMRKIEHHLFKFWDLAREKNERYLPHEYIYQVLESGALEKDYEIDPQDSWVLAAAQKNLPLVVPGWEDSTCGNMFAATCLMEKKDAQIVKSGVEYMMWLADWYQEVSRKHDIGFFQIGGGIAGDFPICVVPMLHQDMKIEAKSWKYFCQISDSTTSYGSYSGAVPNEKITWGKLDVDTPRFIIESDATIVAPLLFAWLLDW